MHEGYTAYEKVSIAMVGTCPLSADERHARLCSPANSQSATVPTPVHWKGFLYRNIFCAACHGAPLSEVGFLRTELVCNGSGAYWQQNQWCAKFRISVDDAPIDMTWLYEYCLVQECEKGKERRCPDKDPHAQECWAYQAAILVKVQGMVVKYRNEACQRCDPSLIITGPQNCRSTDMRCPLRNTIFRNEPWMHFFYFTGRCDIRR